MPTKILIFLFLGLALQSANAGGGKPTSLVLTPSSGKAPLEVHIKGPALLTKNGTNSFNKWVGCQYNVDWGDPTPPAKTSAHEKANCSDDLVHVFNSPGKFKVQASTFHANPDDSHTTDWSGAGVVTVK